MPGGGAQMPFDINNLLSNPGFMNLVRLINYLNIIMTSLFRLHQ